MVDGSGDDEIRLTCNERQGLWQVSVVPMSGKTGQLEDWDLSFFRELPWLQNLHGRPGVRKKAEKKAHECMMEKAEKQE